MNGLATGKFWTATVERAVKTFAGTLGGMWAADSMFNILHTNLMDSVGVALSTTAISVLMSVASSPVGGDSTSPSLTDAK